MRSAPARATGAVGPAAAASSAVRTAVDTSAPTASPTGATPPTFASAGGADLRPLVIHVVYRFDTGGLENGIVNLINRMPADRFRHAIVALTDASDFRRRLQRDDVQIVALHKPPGHGIWLYPALWRLFRTMRPTIVHTRNLAALEALAPAWAARVPVRIHGEHGRDVDDLDGTSAKHRWLRRLYQPFVHHWLTVSRDLAGYLADRLGVSAAKVTQVYNGVDAEHFRPRAAGDAPLPGCPFVSAGLCVVGSVGRMQAVKDHALLVRAFLDVLRRRPELRSRLRLVIVGDGPLHGAVQASLGAAGMAHLAWLPGERADVADVMRAIDIFVLPSLAEGISNTILEAMASGLPVVATAVGGNADLVDGGSIGTARNATGIVVPPGDVTAMAAAIERLVDDPVAAAAMGRAGRARALERFSLASMVGTYQSVYEQQSQARMRLRNQPR
jgi:sugar transferase (PEP-CTERM/EpsH1 system associated)